MTANDFQPGDRVRDRHSREDGIVYKTVRLGVGSSIFVAVYFLKKRYVRNVNPNNINLIARATKASIDTVNAMVNQWAQTRASKAPRPTAVSPAHAETIIQDSLKQQAAENKVTPPPTTSSVKKPPKIRRAGLNTSIPEFSESQNLVGPPIPYHLRTPAERRVLNSNETAFLAEVDALLKKNQGTGVNAKLLSRIELIAVKYDMVDSDIKRSILLTLTTKTAPKWRGRKKTRVGPTNLFNRDPRYPHTDIPTFKQQIKDIMAPEIPNSPPISARIRTKYSLKKPIIDPEDAVEPVQVKLSTVRREISAMMGTYVEGAEDLLEQEARREAANAFAFNKIQNIYQFSAPPSQYAYDTEPLIATIMREWQARRKSGLPAMAPKAFLRSVDYRQNMLTSEMFSEEAERFLNSPMDWRPWLSKYISHVNDLSNYFTNFRSSWLVGDEGAETFRNKMELLRSLGLSSEVEALEALRSVQFDHNTERIAPEITSILHGLNEHLPEFQISTDINAPSVVDQAYRAVGAAVEGRLKLHKQVAYRGFAQLTNLQEDRGHPIMDPTAVFTSDEIVAGAQEVPGGELLSDPDTYIFGDKTGASRRMLNAIGQEEKIEDILRNAPVDIVSENGLRFTIPSQTVLKGERIRALPATIGGEMDVVLGSRMSGKAAIDLYNEAISKLATMNGTSQALNIIRDTAAIGESVIPTATRSSVKLKGGKTVTIDDLMSSLGWAPGGRAQSILQKNLMSSRRMTNEAAEDIVQDVTLKVLQFLRSGDIENKSLYDIASLIQNQTKSFLYEASNQSVDDVLKAIGLNMSLDSGFDAAATATGRSRIFTNGSRDSKRLLKYLTDLNKRRGAHGTTPLIGKDFLSHRGFSGFSSISDRLQEVLGGTFGSFESQYIDPLKILLFAMDETKYDMLTAMTDGNKEHLYNALTTRMSAQTLLSNLKDLYEGGILFQVKNADTEALKSAVGDFLSGAQKIIDDVSIETPIQFRYSDAQRLSEMSTSQVGIAEHRRGLKLIRNDDGTFSLHYGVGTAQEAIDIGTTLGSESFVTTGGEQLKLTTDTLHGFYKNPAEGIGSGVSLEILNAPYVDIGGKFRGLLTDNSAVELALNPAEVAKSKLFNPEVSASSEIITDPAARLPVYRVPQYGDVNAKYVGVPQTANRLPTNIQRAEYYAEMTPEQQVELIHRRRKVYIDIETHRDLVASGGSLKEVGKEYSHIGQVAVLRETDKTSKNVINIASPIWMGLDDERKALMSSKGFELIEAASVEDADEEILRKVYASIKGYINKRDAVFVVVNEGADLGKMAAAARKIRDKYTKLNPTHPKAREFAEIARKLQMANAQAADLIFLNQIQNPGVISSLERMSVQAGVTSITDTRTHFANMDVVQTAAVVKANIENYVTPEGWHQVSLGDLMGDPNNPRWYVLPTARSTERFGLMGHAETSNRAFRVTGLLNQLDPDTGMMRTGLQLLEYGAEKPVSYFGDNTYFLAGNLTRMKPMDEPVETYIHNVAADLSGRRIHRLLADSRKGAGDNFEYLSLDVRFQAMQQEDPVAWLKAMAASSDPNAAAFRSQIEWAIDNASDPRMRAQWTSNEFKSWYENDWSKLHKQFFTDLEEMSMQAHLSKDQKAWIIRKRFELLYGPGGLSGVNQVEVPTTDAVRHWTPAPQFKRLSNQRGVSVYNQESTEFGLIEMINATLSDDAALGEAQESVRLRNYKNMVQRLLGIDDASHLVELRATSSYDPIRKPMLRHDLGAEIKVRLAQEALRQNVAIGDENLVDVLAQTAHLPVEETVAVLQDAENPIQEMAKAFHGAFTSNPKAFVRDPSITSVHHRWLLSQINPDRYDEIRTRSSELLATMAGPNADWGELGAQAYAEYRKEEAESFIALRKRFDALPRELDRRLKSGIRGVEFWKQEAYSVAGSKDPRFRRVGLSPTEVVETYGSKGELALAKLLAKHNNKGFLNDKQVEEIQSILGWVHGASPDDIRIPYSLGRKKPVYMTTTLGDISRAMPGKREEAFRKFNIGALPAWINDVFNQLVGLPAEDAMSPAQQVSVAFAEAAETAVGKGPSAAATAISQAERIQLGPGKFGAFVQRNLPKNADDLSSKLSGLLEGKGLVTTGIALAGLGVLASGIGIRKHRPEMEENDLSTPEQSKIVESVSKEQPANYRIVGKVRGVIDNNVDPNEVVEAIHHALGTHMKESPEKTQTVKDNRTPINKTLVSKLMAKLLK